jgi:hypothetical protein
MRRLASVLAVATAGALTAVPAAHADPPQAPHCDPGWTFKLVKLKQVRQVGRETFRHVNRTKRRVEATFTTKKSKTVTWTASGDVGGSIDLIIAEVKAGGGGSVSKASTTEVGISTTVPVPRKSAVVASFGVFVRPVIGVLRRGDKNRICQERRKVKVILPAGTGWLTRDEPL